ncbi:MAG: hypothetical protein U0795_25490 [Pirellulales bacterium]
MNSGPSPTHAADSRLGADSRFGRRTWLALSTLALSTLALFAPPAAAEELSLETAQQPDQPVPQPWAADEGPQLLAPDEPLVEPAGVEALPPLDQRSADATHQLVQQWQQGADVRQPFHWDQLPDNLQLLVRRSLLENLPNPYEDRRHWGGTTKVIDGWDVWRDDWRIKTKRKWKEVNHGNWYAYKLTQVDPASNLSIAVTDLHEVAPGTLDLTVTLKSRVKAFARMSRWRYGVQTISLSMDAEADVETRLDCHVQTRLDFAHLPPDLVIQPEVRRAELKVPRFEVERISQIHGDVAEELGRQLHKVLNGQLEDLQPKLAERINRQLRKRPDRLRLSLHDWVNDSWQDWVVPDSASKPAPAK